MAATIVGPARGVAVSIPGGCSVAYNVTATGAIKSAPGIVAKISCATAGSLTLNDALTAGGSSITNQIWSGSLTAGQVVVLDWPCVTGICVSALTSAVVSISFT